MSGGTGNANGRKAGSYGTVEGRTAEALDTEDEWDKDCSRGNGAYRDYIWVRSKKERVSLFLSLADEEFFLFLLWKVDLTFLGNHV